MLKSYSKYITFTDVDGDSVAVLKSAIESVCQDHRSGNIIVELIGGAEYELPCGRYSDLDSIISKIFY